jgi:hypothetical protein
METEEKKAKENEFLFSFQQAVRLSSVRYTVRLFIGHADAQSNCYVCLLCVLLLAYSVSCRKKTLRVKITSLLAISVLHIFQN